MKKTKTQKGITLIALIITIIVLLILAVVAIGAVQNDGIINHAKNAREEYQSAQVNENSTLDHYLGMIEGNAPSGEQTTKLVSEAQGKVLSTASNTEVLDAYGNKIVVPAGFKITTDASLVTEGIVIEDCTETGTKGSQFVWIPVGTIYGDAEHTEDKTKTITLGRYGFDSEGYYTPDDERFDTSYTENLKGNTTAQNAIAKDIEAFKTSATTNGGYYIGRYEAGVTNYDVDNITTNSNDETNWTGYQTTDGKDPQIVCKSGVTVWNYVTQKKASELSGNMYNSSEFTSDLINSYAWDTALMFIQTFGIKSNSLTYSTVQGRSSENKLQTTGTNKLKSTTETDEQLNIYDMAGNCNEWSTEYSDRNSATPVVFRGGRFDWTTQSEYSGDRDDHNKDYSAEWITFRPIIYLAN